MTRADETTFAVACDVVEALVAREGRGPTSELVSIAVLCVEAVLAARHGHRLLDDASVARHHGPVMPALWAETAPWGGRPIASLYASSSRRFPGPVLDPRVRRAILDVLDALGPSDRWDPQALLRGPDSPWTLAARRGELPSRELPRTIDTRAAREPERPFPLADLVAWAATLPTPAGGR